jgi:hypothetical protein|tara:strand:- start:61 stop:831 length:771 start_codon:yes stop_codon:yes gene_type:complete
MSFNIIKFIARQNNIDIQDTYDSKKYIKNNITILLDKTDLFIKNINTIELSVLYSLLDDNNINYDNIFKIIKLIDIDIILKLLYYDNFSYNTVVLSILLMKLLNNNNIYDLCCSRKPFKFIKQSAILIATIKQLKEYYIFIYNENIKCKCFKKYMGNDFTLLIQDQYFGLNINIFLDNLKKLILTLEYIYNFYKEYYYKEYDYRNTECKNQQMAIIYYEDFNSFEKKYRKNIELPIINYKITNLTINIDNILKLIC